MQSWTLQFEQADDRHEEQSSLAHFLPCEAVSIKLFCLSKRWSSCKLQTRGRPVLHLELVSLSHRMSDAAKMRQIPKKSMLWLPSWRRKMQTLTASIHISQVNIGRHHFFSLKLIWHWETLWSSLLSKAMPKSLIPPSCDLLGNQCRSDVHFALKWLFSAFVGMNALSCAFRRHFYQTKSRNCITSQNSYFTLFVVRMPYDINKILGVAPLDHNHSCRSSLRILLPSTVKKLLKKSKKLFLYFFVPLSSLVDSPRQAPMSIKHFVTGARKDPIKGYSSLLLGLLFPSRETSNK